ncbi:MAG: hypothetical protein ACRCX2_01405 [Paraclostridium sp.]
MPNVYIMHEEEFAFRQSLRDITENVKNDDVEPSRKLITYLSFADLEDIIMVAFNLKNTNTKVLRKMLKENEEYIPQFYKAMLKTYTEELQRFINIGGGPSEFFRDDLKVVIDYDKKIEEIKKG